MSLFSPQLSPLLKLIPPSRLFLNVGPSTLFLSSLPFPYMYLHSHILSYSIIYSLFPLPPPHPSHYSSSSPITHTLLISLFCFSHHTLSSLITPSLPSSTFSSLIRPFRLRSHIFPPPPRPTDLFLNICPTWLQGTISRVPPHIQV